MSGVRHGLAATVGSDTGGETRSEGTRPTAGGRGPAREAGRGGGGAGHGRAIRAIAVLVVVAAVVLVGLVLVAGPAAQGALVGLARSNPSAMKIGFVADAVKGDLGTTLTDPAGAGTAKVHFEVPAGATVSQVAGALQRQGLVKDALAVTYLVVTGNLTDQVEAGAYDLDPSMTPAEIISRLQRAPVATIDVKLREGLRLEQIAAYLQTLGLKMDVRQFYQAALHPAAALRTDYPILSPLPAGHSLEGYLGAGTFQVYEDVTPDEMVRKLLDLWKTNVGDGPIAEAKRQGRDFYQVLALASLVEQEAAVDAERPVIAGVYANRLAKGMPMDADPTVIYGSDTVALRKLAFDQWPTFSFWEPLAKPATVNLPKDLAGFQTYQHAGMIPGPISTPQLASIEAALHPDTKTGYLYFVAKGDGSHTHAFARTYAEHLANLKKYGYQ